GQCAIVLGARELQNGITDGILEGSRITRAFAHHDHADAVTGGPGPRHAELPRSAPGTALRVLAPATEQSQQSQRWEAKLRGPHQAPPSRRMPRAFIFL